MKFFGISGVRWQIAMTGLWIIVQALLLVVYGIKTNGEALRIIRESENLSTHGSFSTPLYFMYLVEILLVSLKTGIGTGFGFIILIHLIVNLIALHLFYKFLTAFYKSEKIAFLACSALILCLPYQLYNTFIYTESLFFSLGIVYSCLLLGTRKLKQGRFAVLSILLLVLCFTRPAGLFFFAATMIYAFVRAAGYFSLSKRMLYLFLCMLPAVFILNFMMGSGDGIDVLIPFREEHVICEVPSNITNQPENNATGNSITGLVAYLTDHPGQFVKLSILRSEAFFGLYRSFYSDVHNTFLMGFFYSLYLMIILAVIKWRKQVPVELIYIFSLVAVFWLSVIFSCDEWHNRFFLTLTPFLIMAAFLFMSRPPEQKQEKY
jgi:hypothetical protein